MKRHIKRIVALILAVLLVFCLLPLSVFAEDSQPADSYPGYSLGQTPDEEAASQEVEHSENAPPDEGAATAEEGNEETEPASEPVPVPDETEPVPVPDETESVPVPEEAEPVPEDGEQAPAEPMTNNGEVVLWEYCDANLYLKDEKHDTWFPYITTYPFNMNPSETEFSSSSKYGQLYYCIDFAATAGNAGTSTPNHPESVLDSQVWLSLSETKKQGITLALIYGMPNHVTADIPDNIYGYAATQLIIWEYQYYGRKTAGQTVTVFNSVIDQSRAAGKLRRAYDAILREIKRHETVPSFNGKEIVLRGYGEQFGQTITDANGLFGEDAWSVAGSNSGIAVKQNGNSLLVYAKDNFPLNETVTVALKRNILTSSGAGLCAYSGKQACVTGCPPDPLDVMIRVRLEAAQLDIIKLTPDGKNVAGVEFEVYRGYDAVESGTPMYVGKTVAGTYQGKPCGRIQVGNLTPGNYYVHEIIPAGYTERPVTSSQNVTEGSGSGAGWYYLKVSASNTGDNPAIVIFENQPLPGTATLKKTSPGGNVEGVCFKLYRWRDESSGQATWYGRSDAAGSVYVTDAGYQQSGAKRYTFEGLMDGAYDFREVLSQTQEVTFPSQWTVKVTDRTGKVTYDKTFTGDQILRDEATGDARLTRDVMGSLTGLTGGGRLEMEIVNVPIPGTARLQKTSSTGDVEGFCFKLYRHGSKETWYGRSGENGGIYLTDSSYEAGEQVYEFAGLTDGTYTVLEALSQSDQHLKTTGWTLTVYNKDGVMTSKQTFGEGEFTFDANGDARLAQVEITGLNGGGRLEISINNEPVLGAITIDKADEAGRPLKGATFRLEYFDGDEWIPVRPGRSAGIGLCSSAGLTADGELTTGESGTVTFEGLMLYDYDEAIVYRVTETKAPPNYQLLAEPVFEDVIQPDTNGVYHAYVDVINTPVFLLPPAGGDGFGLLPLAVLGMAACAAAIRFIISRKKSTIN